MDKSYLIVGLGNPGSKYALTRHNVGFIVVDYLAEKLAAQWNLLPDKEGLIGITWYKGDRIWLLKPCLYMNFSGKVVKSVLNLWQGSLDGLMIILDDVNLPLGTLRMRATGSDGGHKGLRSVIEEIGTCRFPRQRIGIGNPMYRGNLSDFVLENFSENELLLIKQVKEKAVEQIFCWINEGIEKAMSKYNGIITCG